METYKVEKVMKYVSEFGVLYYHVFFDGEWCDLAACVNCEAVGFLQEGYKTWDYDRLRVCGCKKPNWYRGLAAIEIIHEFVKEYYGDVK